MSCQTRRVSLAVAERSPVVVRLIEQTPQMLRMQADNPERLAAALGCTLAEGGLLPADVVCQYVDRAISRPGWIGVFAIAPGDILVGSGIFKSTPIDGIVEIGYGVSPQWEGRGIATAIAEGLCKIAFLQNASAVIAHTLPDSFASQRVLAKVGFQRIGMAMDPEDGEVIQFRRSRP